MTRTREDGKEEVFSACIKPDDTRYLGGDKILLFMLLNCKVDLELELVMIKLMNFVPIVVIGLQ